MDRRGGVEVDDALLATQKIDRQIHLTENGKADFRNQKGRFTTQKIGRGIYIVGVPTAWRGSVEVDRSLLVHTLLVLALLVLRFGVQRLRLYQQIDRVSV